jgi:hypothetical protein
MPSLRERAYKFERALNQIFDLEIFFYRALYRQMHLAEGKWGPPHVNYYEFGVGSGMTLSAYIEALKLICAQSNKDIYQYHIFGFDSFKGLPRKEHEKDNHCKWNEGRFSHSLSAVEKKVFEQGIDLKRGTVHFVKGFFKETLTRELREKLLKWPPSIITIDVDYYSSTKTALEWLRPMLASGTLFYFDDIWCFHGNPHYGELAAINEFNKVGEGLLTQYPLLGLSSMVFIYSKKKFEFSQHKRKGIAEDVAT